MTTPKINSNKSYTQQDLLATWILINSEEGATKDEVAEKLGRPKTATALIRKKLLEFCADEDVQEKTIEQLGDRLFHKEAPKAFKIIRTGRKPSVDTVEELREAASAGSLDLDSLDNLLSNSDEAEERAPQAPDLFADDQDV